MFASQLSTHLLERGHEVRLVSLLQGESLLPFNGKHIQLNRPLSRRFFDEEGWKSLDQLIKEFKPDVVQANAGDTLKLTLFKKCFI